MGLMFMIVTWSSSFAYIIITVDLLFPTGSTFYIHMSWLRATLQLRRSISISNGVDGVLYDPASDNRPNLSARAFGGGNNGHGNSPGGGVNNGNGGGQGAPGNQGGNGQGGNGATKKSTSTLRLSFLLVVSLIYSRL